MELTLLLDWTVTPQPGTIKFHGPSTATIAVAAAECVFDCSRLHRLLEDVDGPHDGEGREDE